MGLFGGRTSPGALRAYPPCFVAESIPPPPVAPAQPPPPLAPPQPPRHKHSPAEKAMSIYQDIVFHCSRHVREKKLCLFIKTSPLITQDRHWGAALWLLLSDFCHLTANQCVETPDSVTSCSVRLRFGQLQKQLKFSVAAVAAAAASSRRAHPPPEGQGPPCPAGTSRETAASSRHPFPASPSKKEPAEKAMSIYQDARKGTALHSSHTSLPVPCPRQEPGGQKMLCLFIKTQLSIARYAGGWAGQRADKDYCVQAP